ncbi:MAG: hypothetical protein E7300_03700 [Lachnospiraceae bacterium]|nr:hypothetical protein [Lachnospiraceae bacterium]
MKKKVLLLAMALSLALGTSAFAADYDTVNSFGRIEMKDLNGNPQNVFDDADLVKIGTKAETAKTELETCGETLQTLEDQLGGFWFDTDADGNLQYHYIDADGNEQSGVIK